MTFLLSSTRFDAGLAHANSVFVADRPLAIGDFQADVGGLAWEDNQVFWSVIKFVSIDVMDDLAFCQRPAELFLGNDPVDGTSPDLGVIRCICRLESSSTCDGTEDSVTAANLGQFGIEDRPAISTGTFLARFPAQCMTSRCAVPPSARSTTSFACVFHSSIVPGSGGKTNSWFSPYCITPERLRMPLFDALDAPPDAAGPGGGEEGR